MSLPENLNLIGSDPLAEAIRGLPHPPPFAEPRTLVTSGTRIPAGAVACGMAMLSPEAEDILPEYLSFNVLNDVRAMIAAGELGQLYGGFASHRIENFTTDELLRELGLLPALALMLALVPGDIVRVWSTAARLLTADEPDAWFVHLRYADDALVTIEVLAVNDLEVGDELTVEITGSEQVVRVEPMRQAVWVEQWQEPANRRLWWELPAERLCRLLAEGQVVRGGGPRVRQIWDAVMESARTGQPVSIDAR